MAAAAEPVAETVLEATVATMRKIHLCKQAHQSAVVPGRKATLGYARRQHFRRWAPPCQALASDSR